LLDFYASLGWEVKFKLGNLSLPAKGGIFRWGEGANSPRPLGEKMKPVRVVFQIREGIRVKVFIEGSSKPIQPIANQGKEKVFILFPGKKYVITIEPA